MIFFLNLPGLKEMNRTLVKMAEGGRYDQAGGGFHRYFTDEKWLVPHFEKMFYDNALLVMVYLEGFQGTGDKIFKRIVEETLSYVKKGFALCRPIRPMILLH